MINNPWIVPTPKPAFTPLPVGSYTAEFAGVSEVTLASGEVKWRFVWEVTVGDQAGKLATTLTDQNLNPASLGGILVAGLLGRQLVAGENVQAAVDSCIGKVYMVSILAGPKGGKPCVRMVMPVPQS